MDCPVGSRYLSELSSAVEGVHDPDPLGIEAGQVVLSFLAEDRIVGARCLEVFHQELVGSAVSFVLQERRWSALSVEPGAELNEESASFGRELRCESVVIDHGRHRIARRRTRWRRSRGRQPPFTATCWWMCDIVAMAGECGFGTSPTDDALERVRPFDSNLSREAFDQAAIRSDHCDSLTRSLLSGDDLDDEDDEVVGRVDDRTVCVTQLDVASGFGGHAVDDDQWFILG